MSQNYKNFLKGIGIVPKATAANTTAGDIEFLTTNNKLNLHNGTSSSPAVTESHASQLANRLQSKDLETSTTRLVDATDTTKRILFSNSGTATGTSTTLTFVQTGSQTITFPDASTTLVGTDATQTLSNKTISGASNTITNIPDTALSTNITTLTGIQTLTNKSISGATNTLTSIPNTALTNSTITVNGTSISLGGSGTVTATATNALTIGTGLTGTSYNGSSAVTVAIDSTVVTLTGTQTLTNKTLTTPTISSILNTGTLTLPITTDTLVGRATTDTLTNKSISGATNTLTAIPNTALTNSSVTVNGITIALGGSGTVTATATAALTIGTGLTGTSYNGSTAVTVAIDATVATLTGTQTLTNKTLTSPVLNTAKADTISAIGTNLGLSATNAISLTAPFVNVASLQVSNTTISDPGNSGIQITSGNAAFGINLNATGTAAIQFQRAGTQVAFIDTGKLALANQSTLQLNDSSTGYVALKAPLTVATPYTITLPSSAPTTGTALVYNGTAYVWSAAGTSGITALTGDVTASGTGSVAATVALVNGQSAAAVATAAISVASATAVVSTNNLVKRDGSGSSNFITLRFDPTNTNTNLVSLGAQSGATSAYTLNLPNAAGTTGQVLSVVSGGGVTTLGFTTPTSGGTSSNYTVDTFSGTGSQTVFTLSVDPITKNNTLINISGVTQQKSTYTVTGTSLTFSTPPPVGTSNIEVVSGTAAPVNSTGYTSSVQISLAASATLTTSLVAGLQAIEVAGASAAVTLSTTPFGSTAPTDKAVITLIGRSSTNTVTVTNNDIAFGTIVNGTATLGLYSSIQFMYLASVSRWVEQSRN